MGRSAEPSATGWRRPGQSPPRESPVRGFTRRAPVTSCFRRQAAAGLPPSSRGPAVLHFDRTRAVEPLEPTAGRVHGEPPETYPSAL